jgi:hypothetical protein
MGLLLAKLYVQNETPRTVANEVAKEVTNEVTKELAKEEKAELSAEEKLAYYSRTSNAKTPFKEVPQETAIDPSKY